MPTEQKEYVCLETRDFDRIPNVVLPPVDETSLVVLAARLCELLAPGYVLEEIRSAPNRTTEEIDLGVYEETLERRYGGEHGILYREVVERSSNGAGPSVSEIRRSVSVPGWSSDTSLELSVLVRPAPFRNAGLHVDGRLGSPSPERLARAFAALDEIFARGQVSR